MSELLSSITGGGSGFQTEGIVSDVLSSGQTGDLLVVPPASGKVYRLKLLAPTSATQDGITLTANGMAINTEDTLVQVNAANATGLFFVGGVDITTTANSMAYNIVECTSFSINKNAGNTSQSIIYSYEIGEYK